MMKGEGKGERIKDEKKRGSVIIKREKVSR